MRLQSNVDLPRPHHPRDSLRCSPTHRVGHALNYPIVNTLVFMNISVSLAGQRLVLRARTSVTFLQHAATIFIS